MAPTATTDNPLESFVDYLISEAGYANLPADYQTTFRDQVRVQVYRRVGMIVLNELSEADAAEFANRFGDQLDQADNAELQQFLDSKISNFSEKLAQGLDQFAEEFFQLRQQK